MEDNVYKRRAILVDYSLLHDKNGTPNYFLLKLTDNLEVSGYSDLIVLAQNPQEAREWVDRYCVGEQVLVYHTQKNLADDIQVIKQTHKSIGAIVGKDFNIEGVNQRLVQVMRILGK